MLHAATAAAAAPILPPPPVLVLTVADDENDSEDYGDNDHSTDLDDAIGAAPLAHDSRPPPPLDTPPTIAPASKNRHDLSVAIYDPDDLSCVAQDAPDADADVNAYRPDHATLQHAADTVTTHWLLHGRIPSTPPRRHRHKPSLTLPLTVDLASPIRSLTHSSAAEAVNDDASMTAPMPSSPPALTESKSSKSSSVPSSDADGFAGAVPDADLAHFEDIGLEDDDHVPTYNASSHVKNNTIRMADRRRVSGPVSAPGRNQTSSTTGGVRELVTNSAMRSPPLGSGPMQPRTAPLRAPASSTARSPFTSGPRTASPRPFGTHSNPSTPSLSSSQFPRRPSSRTSTRSPSPNHSLPGQMQGPVGSLPNSAGSPPAFLSNSSRRGSAALQKRKTTKELEQEYAAMDDDDDGALPDDANLWNVPMSPSLYRQASEVASSNNTSADTSPERASPRATPRPSRLRPDAARRESGPRTAPMSLRPWPQQHLHASAEVQTPNRYTFNQQSRARSWDNVLSELSEEAKDLSLALDLHETALAQRHESVPADTKETRPTSEGRRQSTGVISPNASTPSLTRARTVELPPLRKNHVMIDPLPISKEKEKVLSRTRPSWLPPKDRKEEKKHLREYQRMMERSMEAEKKRAASLAAESTFRVGTSETLTRIWDKHVFPKWETAMSDSRTRELWWRGIPNSCRAEAWQRGIGNELGLTATTYSKALGRAQTSAAARLPPWKETFDNDLAQTFPALGLFQRGQALHASLSNILDAYTSYRSDVGYRSGLHLPAAMLLLVLRDEERAFTALANLLNRPIPLAFLTRDKPGMDRAFGLIVELVRTQLPRLASHLFSKDSGLGLAPAEVFSPMLSSFFLNGCSDTYARHSSSRSGTPLSSPSSANRNSFPGADESDRGVSLQLALRLWDVLIFDGDAALVRTTAGILAAEEARLYGDRAEVLSLLGTDGALRLGGTTPISRDASESITSGEATGGAYSLEQLQGEEWSETVEAAMKRVREIGRRKGAKVGKDAKDGKNDRAARKENLSTAAATTNAAPRADRKAMRLEVLASPSEKALEAIMSPTIATVSP